MYTDNTRMAAGRESDRGPARRATRRPGTGARGTPDAGTGLRAVGPLVLLSVVLSLAGAESGPPAVALSRLPVREVTVFKDGHAWVLQAGSVPTDESGNVVLDDLPSPVLGTFWPYADDPQAKLLGVVAAADRVAVKRPAVSVRELLEANPGAEVVVSETGRQPYPATVEAVLTPGDAAGGAGEPGPVPEAASAAGPARVVLLRTGDGVRAVNLERLEDVTFRGAPTREVSRQESRRRLTLRLGWADGRRGPTAAVGMAYVQLGLRWIPSYRVSVNGKGGAVCRFQATLVNELIDLDDVTLHLVVGVPSFAFRDDPDPVSLQQTLARVAAQAGPHSRTAMMLSNAIMTQQFTPAAPEPPAAGDGRTIDLGPEVAGSARAEDLHVFHLPHVSLRKGQRLVVPVAEFALAYRDVYTLDIPFAPPPDLWRNHDSDRQAELARLFATPKVMHRLRFTNGNPFPLTTAPVLLFRGDQVLAQGLMTYAATGGTTDVDVTTALHIRVCKTDTETSRTPNAATFQGDSYQRIDMDGTVALRNTGPQATDVEVRRYVLGQVKETDNGGSREMVNMFEDPGFLPADRGDGGWAWLWQLGWPYWWHRVNGVSLVRWSAKLEPGADLALHYSWCYYWR